MLVRPHDLEIRAEPDGQSTFPAEVLRILAAGPQVKIELSGPSSAPVNVEMPHEHFRRMKIAAGDRVYVRPRDARVFTEDYSI